MARPYPNSRELTRHWISVFVTIPIGIIIALAASSACAKEHKKYEQDRPLTADQVALVQKAMAQEKVLIKGIQMRAPLVETYIQDTKPDAALYEVPFADHYMLSRVDFGDNFFDRSYTPKQEQTTHSFFKGSREAIMGLTKALHLDLQVTYSDTGFMQMMFIDPSGFDQRHYEFSFVEREFLGSVRTSVFDVHPKADAKGMGRFYGRIWVEDQDGNVVRFSGAYTGPAIIDTSKFFFHFDSWRVNVQPGIWLPVAIYVEATQRTESDKSVGLKAQTHFWGYSLKMPTRDSENVTIKVDEAVDRSSDAQDVGPQQASQLWNAQTERRVIDRLMAAGLVAPVETGGFENKVLDQIVVNLAVPNNLAFAEQIHNRVLLTDTIEATTLGNTILISRGLIDSLPSEEAMASVVAMELAHIALGHHIDRRLAFNEDQFFPDTATFQKFNLNHTDADNDAAAKKATEYLENSIYKDKLANAGLYYEQLADRAKVLKALTTPNLGDSLLKPDGTPWMTELEHMAPGLNWDDLSQTPALPLGSWLKIDPWDDTVHMLNATRYAPASARDKIPFEVTPIFYKLQRSDGGVATPAGAPGATPDQAQPASPASINPGL
jgi:hypothetical protein